MNPAHVSLVETEVVSTNLETVDTILSEDRVFFTPPDDVDQMRVALVRHAARVHIEHNPAFARYCARRDWSPDHLATPADLLDVPVLPSALFKREAIDLTTRWNPADVPMPTTSSGTQGSVSVIPRDDVTLTRFFASASAGVRDVLGFEDFSARIANLGPSTKEAEHLWIAYVLAGIGVFLNSTNYVRDGVLQIERLHEDLARHERDPMAIIGPPALLLDLADHLDAGSPLSMEPTSIVMSVGGWKRTGSDRLVDRDEFSARMQRAFGLERSQVRDAFNMVELNTVIYECRELNKHIPPWLFASARDPKTLEPLGSGEVGILAYLDPTAKSFPGFVLSDDFGTVTRRVACECGITGDILEIERRINRVESRGCALKMTYSGGTK